MAFCGSRVSGGAGIAARSNALYRPEMIHAQMDLAAHAYLSTEADYNSGKNTSYLPRLFRWFGAILGAAKAFSACCRMVVPSLLQQSLQCGSYRMIGKWSREILFLNPKMILDFGGCSPQYPAALECQPKFKSTNPKSLYFALCSSDCFKPMPAWPCVFISAGSLSISPNCCG